MLQYQNNSMQDYASHYWRCLLYLWPNGMWLHWWFWCVFVSWIDTVLRCTGSLLWTSWRGTSLVRRDAIVSAFVHSSYYVSWCVFRWLNKFVALRCWHNSMLPFAYCLLLGNIACAKSQIFPENGRWSVTRDKSFDVCCVRHFNVYFLSSIG